MSLYAEVIGAPVAHSLSPSIHRHWLSALGMDADFRATRVEPEDLGAYLRDRAGDPDWRGCSVTLPHKVGIMPLLSGIDGETGDVGAVNCVHRRGDGLFGTNTDVEGIDYALTDAALAGGKVVVIGAGGAARAMLAWLARREPAETVLLVRDPARAAGLCGRRVRAARIEAAANELAGAALIVNASPLGMAGAAAMPVPLLDALARAPGATVMDMVYRPRPTELLNAAGANGQAIVDGLEMLIGQARRAYALFFGAEPPSSDGGLRAMLIGQDRHGV